jgi:hypothetical protein
MIFHSNLLKVEINTVKLIRGEDSLIFMTDILMDYYPKKI